LLGKNPQDGEALSTRSPGSQKTVEQKAKALKAGPTLKTSSIDWGHPQTVSEISENKVIPLSSGCMASEGGRKLLLNPH